MRGGFLQIGEEGMSVLLLATWPAMGEREKEIFVVEIFWWKCVEVGILEKIGILEKWNSFGL